MSDPVLVLIGVVIGFVLALALHAFTGFLAGRRLASLEALDFYTVPSVDADIALGHGDAQARSTQESAIRTLLANERIRRKRG